MSFIWDRTFAPSLKFKRFVIPPGYTIRIFGESLDITNLNVSFNSAAAVRNSRPSTAKKLANETSRNEAKISLISKSEVSTSKERKLGPSYEPGKCI